MADSSPPLPRRGFPSALAARPVRTTDGGASGGTDDRPLAAPGPPTDGPSTSCASAPARRGFPSALAARAAAAAAARSEEDERPLSPASAPLPPSPSPPPSVASTFAQPRTPSPATTAATSSRPVQPDPAAVAASSFASRTPSPAAVQQEEAQPAAADATPSPPPRPAAIMCPYLTTGDDGGGRHEIPFGEFHLHLIECRGKYFVAPDLVPMARCRYNGSHYIPAPELSLHERLCRDDRRMQIEDEMRTEPTPIVVYEGSSDEETSDSDDDGSYEMVDGPETREHGERGEQKREAEKREEVGGQEEYGRVVHDLIDI